IRAKLVTGVQTCALLIWPVGPRPAAVGRVERHRVKGPERLALHADHDGAAGAEQHVAHRGYPLLDAVLLGQAVLRAELPGAGPRSEERRVGEEGRARGAR